jgi:hypothetical protein
VLFEGRGEACRPLDDRQLARALLLGSLDAALDVAHGVEVLGRSATESRMLRSFSIRARRAAASVLWVPPNSRSKTARGSFSIGIGVVGVRHEIVFAYAQL